MLTIVSLQIITRFTQKTQLKTPKIAIIFWRCMKSFVKRKFHTFPSIFI